LKELDLLKMEFEKYYNKKIKIVRFEIKNDK
jgi:hypothetical protein